MKKVLYLLLGVLLINGVTSCSDNTIGTSVTDTRLEIVADSSFTVTGSSVKTEQILTRTMTQLLGAINVDNFGELSSDFVCQFLPTTAIDTTGVTADMVDSIRLILRSPVGGYTGDSIMPMRINVYQLNQQLKAPLSSSFDPEGYYNQSDLLGSISYTATRTASPDLIHTTVEKGTYRTIVLTLPKELAVKMFKEYKENPETFRSIEKFNQFFPGIYATNSYGSGRITKIDKTFMLINFRRHSKTSAGNDTIVRDSASYATAAPEVITNNNIKMKVAESIINRVKQGEAILQAPIGYEVNIQFPIEEIVGLYKNDPEKLKVINSLSFSIPVEEIKNDYKITPPKHLLLIRTSKKDKFFANNELPDSKTNFYATYNAETKSYTFGGMRQYLLDLINADSAELRDASNLTIVPVDVESEVNYGYYNSTTTLTSMTPAVSGPMIAKLNLDKAKITFVYSKQELD